MAEYTKIITNKGLELIASSALNGGELVIKSIVIGDANGQNYVPTATQTSLINKRQELQISEMIVNSDTSYTFLAQIPQDIDYFIIREIGLIDVNDNLIEIAQIEQETYIQSDNLVQQLTIGIQIDVGQSSTVVVLADTNIETASKNYVKNNYQKLNEKGTENGYCPLGENAIVPMQYIPELNYANTDLSNLSATGEARFDNKADLDLSNLSATGEAKFVKPDIAVTHTANNSVGSSTNPVYVASNGSAVACGFSWSTIHAVISTYKSGTSWYRVWSDGWIEQGGLTAESTDKIHTVSFLKPFSNTYYTAMCCVCDTTAAAVKTWYDTQIVTKAKANMTIGNNNATSRKISWYACGY